jgi:hypothetical protein
MTGRMTLPRPLIYTAWATGAVLLAFIGAGMAGYAGLPVVAPRWIIMGLGGLAFFGVGCGLMALMFWSARSGHDDAADAASKRVQDQFDD